jgi:glyoxylase I family protein
MEPLSIHHVAINVSDVPESVAFYTDVLGGEVRSDRPDFGVKGAWIDLGTQQVHLLEAPVPRNLGQHFAVRVDDLDAVVVELRTKGVDIADPVDSGSNRQTFLDDPSGNAIELHEVRDAGR